MMQQIGKTSKTADFLAESFIINHVLELSGLHWRN